MKTSKFNTLVKRWIFFRLSSDEFKTMKPFSPLDEYKSSISLIAATLFPLGLLVAFLFSNFIYPIPHQYTLLCAVITLLLGYSIAKIVVLRLQRTDFIETVQREYENSTVEKRRAYGSLKNMFIVLLPAVFIPWGLLLMVMKLVW